MSDSQQPSTTAGMPGQVAVFFATGAWVGLLVPFAPGTFGAIWGVPLVWGLSYLPGVLWQAAAIAVLYVVGIPLCTAAARALGKKDPGAVVWDEIVTVPIVFLGLPAGRLWEPLILLIGFVLHRLFDISKVPPANQLERLPDGLGIMTDDVVAGLYGCLALHGLLWCGL